MPAAFGTLDEPTAWLIRGLVEYGYVDASATGGRIPPGGPGAIDTSAALDGTGPLLLRVPGSPDGGPAPDDEYVFELGIVRKGAAPAVGLRCPEANYVSELPFDPAQPLHGAGYVHQALQQYVPPFVAWRRRGGELTAAQVRGIPPLRFEPWSSALVEFARRRIAGDPFHQGPALGWWFDAPKAPTTSTRTSNGAVAWAGRVPTGGGVDVRRMLQAPSVALGLCALAGTLTGVVFAINFVATLVVFGVERPHALLSSVALGVPLFVGGVLAMLGARAMSQGRKSPLVWISILYAAAAPLGCFVGIGIAVWAARTWQRPSVVAARA